MKKIVGYDQAIGDDGAKVSAQLGVEGANLKLELSGLVPIAVVVEPATKALDNAMDKLKAIIPGTWDDVMIDKFKQEYKEELVKLLAE